MLLDARNVALALFIREYNATLFPVVIRGVVKEIYINRGTFAKQYKNS